MSDETCLCPGCSAEIRAALFHSCETLDPIYDSNPDWTTPEVVALARAQAAELLKIIQRQKPKPTE